MALSQHEFYLKVVNTGHDVDRAYGNQCWDLFAYFCQLNGYTVPHCIYSGGVKDIIQLWKENKYDLQKNFESIAFENKQDGDWFVYGPSQGGGYGHVCMYRKDNGNGTGVVLGQNQGAYNGVANQINLSYNGLGIILRPKCWSKKAEKTKSQNSVDQVLTKNSKVKFSKEYTVSQLNYSQNTVYLKELGIWVKASELTETKNGN